VVGFKQRKTPKKKKVEVETTIVRKGSYIVAKSETNEDVWHDEGGSINNYSYFMYFSFILLCQVTAE